jgi:hypothetical protein
MASIAAFTMPFSQSLPTYLVDDGPDLVESASRIGQVPVNGVMTNLVQVIAPDAVLAAIAELPDVVRLPDG